jgi:hypothetical protein
MKLVYYVALAVTASFIQSDDQIRTDGVLSSSELKNAEKHELKAGYKLYTKKSGAILYLAMTGEQKFWAHVYLSDTESLSIMHASAAIDAVTYKRNNTIWTTGDSFHFELRDRVYDSRVDSIMTKYMATHGWVANNSNIGNSTTIEFRINIGKWKQPLYFACVFAGHDMTFYPFPTTISDDALLPRLVQGYTPDSLKFEPGKWSRIK